MMLRLALSAILLLAAVLRLWRLEQNGFGNEYYAAGVRSMSTGWHNFLYHAFDPAGFVSVDKPPIAMWVQVASVKLFGFDGLSVLVPQALEGVAAVALLFHLVRRRFGAPAALLAALFLALTPVTVAVDRSSNAESCLVLVLLLAAWAASRAAEDGSRGQLVLAMALVGLAFNVKMLAAFVVLPTFALVYWLGASATRGRRLADLTLGGVVLLIVSLAWVAFYDLTPADRRPYAGTTDGNSIAELVIGPYGIGRFVRQPRLAAIPSLESESEVGSRASEAPAAAPASLRPRPGEAAATRRGRLFVSAPAGPLRLTDGQLAGQVAWLLPLALAGAALGALEAPRCRSLDPGHLALVLWSGWALTYAAVYSAAGGFFHFHYLATMGPPLAALAGIGAVAVWRHAADPGWRGLLAPAALLTTAAWQLHIDASALGDQPGWQRWLHVALFGGTLFAVGWLLVTWARPSWQPFARALTTGALSLGLVVLLLMPVAWTLSVVLVPVNGILPSADLGRLLTVDAGARARVRAATATNVAKLIEFLNANRADERYLLAASTTMLAAPIIIQTGEPVMARGGFHGLDPILTPDKLGALVARRQVRFVMLGDLSFVSRRLGAETAGRPIADWVRANGTPVDPALWRAVADRRSGMQLYDLRPVAGYRVGATAAAPGRIAPD
jgi:4-amino-4-deoxy-L-arabinose transferase-like glycosyltransferase